MNRPAEHFQGRADDERVLRVWERVSGRLVRRRRQRPLRLAALAVGCAALLSLIVYLTARSPRSALAPQVIQLADGSRVEHGPSDRLEVGVVTAGRVELRMIDGRALFRVAPNKDRVFLTRAGGYTIRVVGTEYTVELVAGNVRVQVIRGEIEVRRDDGDDVWHVRAGEAWSSSVPASSSGAALVENAATRLDASAPPGAEQPAPGAVPPSPAPPASSVAPLAGSAGKKASLAPPPTPEAAALFQRAQDARVAGRRDEAMRLLAEFLQRFPGDSRAQLAAFELGKIRLETGDARGALDALDRAEGTDAFAEQVEARRVQALEQSGDLASCRTARARYLQRFPNGSFAAVVRRRCP
jgi:transmembrane sensor